VTGPGQVDPVRLATDSLAAAGVDGVSAAPSEPRALVVQLAQLLAEAAPPGFTALHAVISMAGDGELADVLADTPEGVVRVQVPVDIVQHARAHRALTVGEAGPWLRLLLDVAGDGTLQVAFDYGDNVIPVEHLLPAEEYLADVERYPRADIALWLLAYMADEGQQMRTAARAARDAEVQADTAPRGADDEIPALPQLWSRMAALAALCRGADTPVGPRTDPAFALYRGDGGGCTLARLPDGRAVLSGGATDSALLTAAYRGAIEFPDLYRGAPRWVHNLYLDERAARGLLSFCYWWDGGHWYRADVIETPQQWAATDEITAGMPGVWTAASTAELVGAVVAATGAAADEALPAADYVRAAEAHVSSWRYLSRLFPNGFPVRFDAAEALAQLDAAGVLLPAHVPLDPDVAKELVAQYCRDNHVDTSGYPLDRLATARMDAGWQVFVPIPEGEIAIGRRVFLVGDDGVVEQATSGPPGEVSFAFATRFAARVRSLPR
jgi:hypothetical protein